MLIYPIANILAVDSCVDRMTTSKPIIIVTFIRYQKFTTVIKQVHIESSQQYYD